MARDGDFSARTKRAAIERQGGDRSLDNCVYLCKDHHLFLGHGMAPSGIDPQGGGSDAWVQLESQDFPYWDVD